MDTLLPIVLAPVALGVLVLALLWVDAGLRGWRRLAARFGVAGEAPPAVRQDGTVGGAGIIQLRGLLRAAVSDAGLYITPPQPMRLTHRPLLIPWNQIAIREERRRLAVPLLTLSVGRVHLGYITLRGGVAGEVVEHVRGEPRERPNA